MLLQMGSSKHGWFSDDRDYHLVEEESTRTVMSALREVIESKGLFCALYSDRGRRLFLTRKAGEKVDPHRLTQVGPAMNELGASSSRLSLDVKRPLNSHTFLPWAVEHTGVITDIARCEVRKLACCPIWQYVISC